MEPDTSVTICGIRMKNPVMAASGTFGYGREYGEVFDLSKMGAIVVKGTTLKPRMGNPPPRLAETPCGLLNSVGLENPGIDVFIERELPYLRGLGVPVIVNVAGETPEEYAEVSKRLDKAPGVAALEVNVSCPNVKKGGMAFGTDPEALKEVISSVRRSTSLPLITKLSPNVSDIGFLARVATNAGSDAISLINTLLGMAIDVNTMKPVLGAVFGGLSGPAVKPVALRMVWEVSSAVRVPVIGMGGITSGTDAVEFLLAGASAVAVGSATLVRPDACLEVVRGIWEFMKEKGVMTVGELVGAAKRKVDSGAGCPRGTRDF
ncbi:MAG TPA: dihydroorotate dehydrogenase [Clostridia bacterium]|nr:dihydroorotate dehydrogenase [Clostridia bacterium]